jgi:tRNA threonylcarbamoyladenosine biosynthesis protein TsaE
VLRSLSLETDSADRTRRVGAILGALVEPGDLVALEGDLGAGKTVFVKGMAAGLGVPPGEVRSPTFTLVQRHDGGRLPLVHVDAYRLAGAEGLLDLGLDEVLDPRAAAVIEWAPRVGAALPRERLEGRFEHAGETRRRLTFEARGARAAALVGALAARLEEEGFVLERQS